MTPVRLTERQYRQLLAHQPITRARKYGNVPTLRDGVVFDSAWEATHYDELKLRLGLGEIRNLRWQVDYPLLVNGESINTAWRADFVYEERHGDDDWRIVYEDTKSEATRRNRAYRIKKKILATMGIHVREVLSMSRPRRRRGSKMGRKRRAR